MSAWPDDRAEQPNLAILDLMLPGIDGLDDWTPDNTEWVTHSLDYDYAGEDGAAITF